MIIHSLSEISSPPLFYEIRDFIKGSSLFLKLEGLNIAGSIKLTTAIGLWQSIENRITPSTKLIESTTGNLGVALSILCKERGIPFVCVADPHILEENENLIRLYGGTVIKVTEKDRNGGYQGTRRSYIQAMLAKDPTFIWLNQHANRHNPEIHYRRTGAEILDQFHRVDYLFIGTGTGGTLMGCTKLFKEQSPLTKIVAVDSEGSVIFGGSPKELFIPGIGASLPPEIVDRKEIDRVVIVKESEARHMCHFFLNTYGLCFGGSTGAALHALQSYQDMISPQSTIVVVSPDFGHRYMKTVYVTESKDLVEGSNN